MPSESLGEAFARVAMDQTRVRCGVAGLAEGGLGVHGSPFGLKSWTGAFSAAACPPLKRGDTRLRAQKDTKIAINKIKSIS